MEFIAARNGTSGAGSSSPVLEKCSNSSAKNRKRCRSSSPCGSISVESVFLITDIDGQEPKQETKNAMRPILPARDERGLTLWKSYQHFAVSGIAPDSPNPAAADARQSKTAAVP